MKKSMSKRVLIPFRYAGGKYYALKILEPFWNQINHDEYREPFAGGASVFFAKPKVEFNWINDIDNDLIQTYEIMANENLRKELINMLSKETASKERHQEILNFKPSNKIEKAFKYFYLNRTSFSGKMRAPSWGYKPKRSLPPERWHERLNPCGNILKDVRITSFDFEKVILAPQQGKQVLLFLDPPYFKVKKDNHYSYHFSKEDHIRLAKLLKETKHKFFLTYDDCPEIRELYSWAKIYPIQFYYRIENSKKAGGRKKGFELVITNYDVNLDFQKKLEEKPELDKLKSPFRFVGSKAQAIKFIKEFWKKVPHTEYREPFFGGGAVFFAKPKSKHNWINDLDKELIITLRIIADSTKRNLLAERLSKEIATKERFEEIKKMKTTSDLETAFKYFYINRTAYSGIMNKPAWGYDDKKSVPPSRWDKRIFEAGEKLEGVKITDLDFEDVILAPKINNGEVFLFVDPPYCEADQERAYKHSFKDEDHIRLAKLLKETQHKFCLTYDDCKRVRELYSWAKIHPVSWRYHTANSNRASRKMGSELIITNF
ncbi:MAG: DNA adenine methylase [Nanobdellota archaeon]